MSSDWEQLGYALERVSDLERQLEERKAVMREVATELRSLVEPKWILLLAAKLDGARNGK